jgi:hypothetical protein
MDALLMLDANVSRWLFGLYQNAVTLIMINGQDRVEREDDETYGRNSRYGGLRLSETYWTSRTLVHGDGDDDVELIASKNRTLIKRFIVTFIRLFTKLDFIGLNSYFGTL